MAVKTNTPRRVAGTVAVAALLGFGALLWRGGEPGGIDDVYAAIFGDPDLGPVDFAALQRRWTPNDALACPPTICSGATVDRSSPAFPVSHERLRAIVTEVAATEPSADVISAADGPQDRYVVRTRLMRFPDTVSVQIIALGEDRSTLALYSRSQIGLLDFGVNRARIERWLERIGQLAAESPPVSEG